jgi:hypothetical protein
MSYFEIFKREIIKHSNADNYFEACEEWDEYAIDYADDDEEYYCICSHPIKQLITIHNRENGNQVVVGSDCICKITNFPNASLYQSVIYNLAELKKNPDDTTIGKSLIEFIRIKGLLEEKHILFLESMRCKRKISPKQESYYSGLKKKIVRLLDRC